MADETNIPLPPSDTVVVESEPTSKPAFLSTTTGKIVAGAAALLVLLVIAGVIIAVFVFGGASGLFGSKGGVEIVSTSQTGSSAPATAPVEVAPIVNPAQRPLSSTFTFRNIFAPTIKPPSVEATASTEVIETPADSSDTSGTTTTTTTTTPTPTTTLFLVNIVTEGDAHKGVFTWNGATYTAGNGETVDGSPWKVIEVGSDSALMLYGDVQATIAIGQGITK